MQYNANNITDRLNLMYRKGRKQEEASQVEVIRPILIVDEVNSIM